ncbi:MAG: type II toxin-antitoxin system Phd/YefM family antitoxin [bacterium]|nr:type II toxin-antitoxin system Phd/YefM family antitoxin [bacterium]
MKSKLTVHRIPITKARINLGQIVRRVHTNKECFILEKDGIPVAGIIDVDELEDYLEVQNPKLAEQIRKGYEAYDRGEGRNLDDFLIELKAEAQKGKKKA